MNFLAQKPSDLPGIAQKILNAFPDERFFALYGEMGVGKTTLIKAFLKVIGVESEVTSPTFSIVNSYETGRGIPVYHFDFYRIKSEEEVYDIGYEEYFFGDAWCFVEWPEKIGDLLPGDCTKIFIETDGDERMIKVG